MLIVSWEEAGYSALLLIAFIIFIKENDDLQTVRSRANVAQRKCIRRGDGAQSH